MSMQLGLFQTARMEQRLVQSPQMIQAMQILQLSSLDLQERIEQELLENPHTLERRPRSLSEQDGSTSWNGGHAR
jgi:RNA polymerase sigma-54 factor